MKDRWLPRPTRFGWAYLGFVGITLLGCINYQLNTGYFLCFVMFAVWVVCLIEARSQLKGLELEFQGSAAVFVGQEVLLEVVVRNALPLVRENLWVQVGEVGQPLMVPAQGEARLQVLLKAARRGWMPAPAVRLQGSDPLGLFGVQESRAGEERVVLVYPALEENPPSWQTTGEATGMRARKAGQDEYQGLRLYQPGDTLRRVAWKRGELPDGNLLTKEFETHLDHSALFSFQQLPASLSTEQKLSRLAAWVVQAQRMGLHYRLTGPGLDAAGAGERHSQHCLTYLAEFPAEPARGTP
ncbi:DUF58 domain-containing protein [Deinococcus roseus]|uniref:DUF58 domain-containing protein n=1 Tax=Deinococcus roseus TaxID=392414 RepID=A0ABQ2CYD6_9DEIO|nr:DUF58 domain-containing protein [Deinococcus roseus]GGJ28335.1 hypothetical protein GCM10008938_13020 [Deinococcus roseus]